MNLADLHEQRAFLLGSLRDLEQEREAGELSDDDYEALRDDYTARAAAVLRQIRAREDAGDPDRAPGGDASSGRPGWVRGVAIAVVVGMVVLAGAGVALFAGDRGADDPLTGSIPAGIAGRLAQAHQLEAQGMALEALKVYDGVLREDPANVEALAYRGWLLRLAGLTDQAQRSLDQAVEIDPGYPDARFFRGMLLFRDRGDAKAGVADFEAFMALGPPPDMVGAVQAILDQARAAAAGAATPTTAPRG